MILSVLKQIAACGEDSTHQFKQDIKSPDSLAAEMVAFSNSLGGSLWPHRAPIWFFPLPDVIPDGGSRQLALSPVFTAWGPDVSTHSSQVHGRYQCGFCY